MLIDPSSRIMHIYKVFLTYDCVQSVISNANRYKVSGLKVSFETIFFFALVLL